ncbi:MAG: hypothetical protein ABJN26_17965 [Stappiaceae bacterium]
MKKIAWMIAPLLGLATITSAIADSVGTISGRFNGEERTWSALKIEGAGSTSTYDEFMPGFTSIHIQGHQGDDFSVSGSLSIGFTVRESGDIDEPSMVFVPGAKLSDYYEANEGALTIDLESIKDQGETMVVTGRATGTLVRTRRKGIKITADPSDTIEVDLSFETIASASQ